MIWGLSLSEILKGMKCDTSASPLFQFKKSFKSYWVLNFKLGTIYTNTPLRVGFSWTTPFRGAQFMVCVTPFRGQFGGVCTRVGSTYVWERAPRGGLLLRLMKTPCYFSLNHCAEKLREMWIAQVFGSKKAIPASSDPKQLSLTLIPL